MFILSYYCRPWNINNDMRNALTIFRVGQCHWGCWMLFTTVGKCWSINARQIDHSGSINLCDGPVFVIYFASEIVVFGSRCHCIPQIFQEMTNVMKITSVWPHILIIRAVCIARLAKIFILREETKKNNITNLHVHICRTII